VLVDSGVLDRGAGRELPTGADEVLVADIYKAVAAASAAESDRRCYSVEQKTQHGRPASVLLAARAR